MGAACGKSKPSKTPEIKGSQENPQTKPEDKSKSHAEGTTNPSPDPGTQKDPTYPLHPERKFSSATKKGSFSKGGAVSSSVNLAAKMNAAMFNSVVSSEGIRKRYRFEPTICGK